MLIAKKFIGNTQMICVPLSTVQGAHALPQTGVNWLAAIGLALSGMTLMITGAFASLLGKNAKH